MQPPGCTGRQRKSLPVCFYGSAMSIAFRPLLRPLLFLLALALLLWFGWRSYAGPAFAAVTVQQGPLVQTVVATGRVAAGVETELGSTLAARVAATPVAEGEEVKAGAVLLQLEDSEQRAEVKRTEALEAQAKAALEEALAQFRRQKTLAGKGFISGSSLDAEEKKLDTARTQYEAARAQSVSARARLDQFQIKAPAAGRLLERRAEVGDLLTVGKAVLSFAVAGPQEIRVDADERALDRLQAGLPAQIQADAFPGKVLAATVTRVAPRVDRNRGTVEVRLALTEPAAAAFLRNDMTVSAEIVVARREKALQIPSTAVLAALPPALAGAVADSRDPATVWVWRVRDGRAELQPVRRGAEGDGWSEIVSGLAADELVLNPAPGAAAGLLPGAKVRAQPGPVKLPTAAAGSPQFNTAVGGGR